MGADSNRVSLRYATESTWGETPTNGPATTELRITSENLSHNKQTLISQELRSDRQVADHLEVGVAAEGPIEFELLYGDWEDFYSNALRSTIVSTKVSSSSADITASGVSGFASGADSFEADQWVRIFASGNGSDGAVAQVVAATASTLTLTGTTLTASTSRDVTVIGRTLTNGTTKTSFFIEADFEDITGVKYFTGTRVDTMDLSIASRQIINGSFQMMAERGFTASTSVASSVVTSAGTNRPMTAASHVGDIFEAGSIVSTALESVTINVANNMRERPQIGQKGSAEHGDGSISVTGTINAYFEDINFYKKFIDHTDSSLSVRMTDPDDQQVIVTLPKLTFSSGNPNAQGLNQDIFIRMDFQARRDSDTDTTIRMDFLPASA